MMFTRLAAASLLSIALLALPAAAQMRTCSGQTFDGQWFFGSEAASVVGLGDMSLDAFGMRVPEGGDVVMLFTVDAFETLRLEALPEPGGDTVIELYDAFGEQLGMDDDGGGNYASRMELGLAPGQYCLRVRGFANQAVMADIRVGRLDHPALTDGQEADFLLPPFDDGVDDFYFGGVDPCTPTTNALAIAGGAAIDGRLASGLSVINSVIAGPYYRFTLASPQTLTLHAENEDADPYMYLFDGGGSLIAENDDYDSLNARIDIVDPLPPGTYCIALEALLDPTLPVTVRLEVFDAQAALERDYAAGLTVPPLDGTWPITDLGLLPAGTARDLTVLGAQAAWFTFENPYDALMVFSAKVLGDSDPMMALFDADGVEIAFNDDADDNFGSEIMIRLDAGIYSLSIAQFSGQYNGMIRFTTERFLRDFD